MKLDFISRKKNTITVTGSIGGSVVGLEDIHTVKSNFVWASANDSYAIITLNVYDIEVVDTIELTYTVDSWSGTLAIDRSIDGFNWDSLSPAFVPSDKTLIIDYTGQDFRDFKFIRIIVTTPGPNFVLTDWKVYGEVTYENTHLISHNMFNLYSPKEIDKFPLYPDLHKQILRMLEGNNDLDTRLFDDSIFQTGGNYATFSTSNVGNVLTVTPENVPVITDAQYIWDFDDDNSGSTSLNNIIVTSNPLIAQTHDYTLSDQPVETLFIPRLLIQTKTYMIEIVKTFEQE